MKEGCEEVDCDVDFGGEDGYDMFQKDWDKLVHQPKLLTGRSESTVTLGSTGL
jgi:hypothetical protein